MAKKDDETEVGTAVAAYGGGGELSLGNEETEGLAGLGYSEKQEDTLVPILSLLQDNSGEVKRQHSKHIEGAMAGNLVIRSLKKVIDVEREPLVVQPCGFQHMWVEWEGEPGEGAVVGQYPFDDRPEEAEERPDPQNPDRTNWVMPSGNRLADTRYHYCQVLLDGVWMPIVLPMGGTNHTVSRQWTGQMKAVRLPNGQPAPAWFRAYGLKTRFNSRGSQSWYTYDLSDLGWITDKSVRDAGRQLFESVQEEIVSPEPEGVAPAGATDEDNIPV